MLKMGKKYQFFELLTLELFKNYKKIGWQIEGGKSKQSFLFMY